MPSLPLRLIAAVPAAAERLDRHAGGQREARARGDDIDALAGAFDDHIEGVVDHVAVVARPAFQKVCSGAAVEDIVTAFRAEIVVA